MILENQFININFFSQKAITNLDANCLCNAEIIYFKIIVERRFKIHLINLHATICCKAGDTSAVAVICSRAAINSST